MSHKLKLNKYIVIAEGELSGCEANVDEEWIKVSLQNIVVTIPHGFFGKQVTLYLEVEDG